MPDYKCRCLKCKISFEADAPSEEAPVKCPRCDGTNVRKLKRQDEGDGLDRDF